MTITIQFDADSLGCPSVDIFLESLGLQPTRWQAAQVCEVEPWSKINIYRMEIPVPNELLASPTWHCNIVENEGSQRFLINGCVVAADVLKKDILSVAIAAFPIELVALSLESLPVIDLSLLTRLRNLTNLNLRGCSNIGDICPLASLKSLTSLDLSACRAVTDLGPVAGLVKLTNLKLYSCRSISDLSPLVTLRNLENLDLSSCKSVTDIRPLSSLTCLKSLNLDGCRSLRDICALVGLLNLTTLNLSRCDALTDFGSLAALINLTTLDLNESKSLKDLQPLAALVSLTSLRLGSCEALKDIGLLTKLVKLRSLSLALCTGVKDVSPLVGLVELSDLDLSGLKSLTDLRPLANLVSLKELDLSMCNAVIDISPLSRLVKLTTLKCWGCRSLSDINGLSDLVSLVSLDLTACNSLVNLSPLVGLANLTWLNLTGRNAVTDISPLACLVTLTNLELGCDAVIDISPLASLVNLTNLDLSGCRAVTDIRPLSVLGRLKELNISELNRLQSIDSLRDLAELKELESTIHPGIVTELLAHVAMLRADIPHISVNAHAWLKEADAFGAGFHTERERLATTLGDAFSLLPEDHEIIPHYETLLGRTPEFTAAPWKAWLLGTARHHGFHLLRQRVDRLKMKDLRQGAVGGICAALPDDEGTIEDRKWACEWLRAMEDAFSNSTRELLPVSAEICLAHARLNGNDALERWLTRFTDPTDVAALDPVQVSLARWQLARGQSEQALAHAAAVQSPRERDPLLVALVQASLASGAEEAGELLLMIEDAALRRGLALKLARDETFARSAANVHRLVVAAGDSPQALGEFIQLLPPDADHELLREISRLLCINATELRDWKITMLQKYIHQIQDQPSFQDEQD